MAESNITTLTPKRSASKRVGGLFLRGQETAKTKSLTPKMGAFAWMPLVTTTPKSCTSTSRYVAPALRSPSKDQDLSVFSNRSRTNSSSSTSSSSTFSSLTSSSSIFSTSTSSSKSGNWRSGAPLPAVFTKPGHILYLPELAFIKPGSCIRKQLRESNNEGACDHPIVPLRTFTNINGEDFLEFMTCTSFGGLGPVACTPDWMKRSARLIEHAGTTAYDRQAPLELEFGSDSFKKPTYVLTGIKYVIELDQVRPYKPSAGTIILNAKSTSHLQRLARGEGGAHAVEWSSATSQFYSFTSGERELLNLNTTRHRSQKGLVMRFRDERAPDKATTSGPPTLSLLLYHHHLRRQVDIVAVPPFYTVPYQHSGQMAEGPVPRFAQLTYASQQHPQYPSNPLQQYPAPASAPYSYQYLHQYTALFSGHRPALWTALELPSYQVNYPPRQPPQHPPVLHRPVPPQQLNSHFRPRSGPHLPLTPPPSFGRRYGPPVPPAASLLKRRPATAPTFTSPQIPSPSISPNPIKLKVGKIYYLPHSNFVPPNSIVRNQKKQDGFWQHPVLVVLVDENFAHFYALTKKPPTAVRELSMCLRLGTTSEDEGPGVLKLAPGSSGMTHETWINLEQRFKIELGVLTHWTVEVQMDPGERLKLQARVDLLEAEQNRFLYKPLDRILNNIPSGTVLLMKNHPGSSTLGAPVVILENAYPRFRFLRIKEKKKSSIWDEPLSEYSVRSRQMGLTISRDPSYGHDGTPVMLLTADSPDLREPSYVEMARKAKWGSVQQFGTWCVPPIQLQPHSMKLMLDYITNLPKPAPHFPQHNPGQLFPEANLVGFLSGNRPFSPSVMVAGASSICTGLDDMFINSHATRCLKPSGHTDEQTLVEENGKE